MALLKGHQCEQQPQALRKANQDKTDSYCLDRQYVLPQAEFTDHLFERNEERSSSSAPLTRAGLFFCVASQSAAAGRDGPAGGRSAGCLLTRLSLAARPARLSNAKSCHGPTVAGFLRSVREGHDKKRILVIAVT